MNRIDFGRKYFRLQRPFKLRIDVRNATVTIIFLVAISGLALLSLMIGTMKLSAAEVFSVIMGELEGIKRTVVIDWRLPRILAAIVFGAALAVSGAIFQSITRNPLGSPDILGFTSGSYTGALVVMLVIKSMSFASVAAGALAGGFIAAAVIYLLAFRNGIQSFRLIIVGIAISTILTSFNSMLLLISEAEVALTAGAWGVGSLNGVTWNYMLPSILIVLVLILFAFMMSRSLQQMELGKDAAKSHGIHFERTQLLLIIIAVSLVATATAIIGPVAFVALAAPQMAFRLAKQSKSLALTAAVGSFVLLSADILAQRLIPGVILPVGVLTLSIGGLYLVWLLYHQARTAL